MRRLRERYSGNGRAISQSENTTLGTVKVAYGILTLGIDPWFKVSHQVP